MPRPWIFSSILASCVDDDWNGFVCSGVACVVVGVDVVTL
jgi:hypothetical protein